MARLPAPAGSFAAELRAHRLAAALSQEELAERAGLTVNAIGALERGERRRPYPNTVRVLADALGLDEQARRSLAAAVPRTPRATNTGTKTGTSTGTGSTSWPPGRLPVPPTPLVGRDTELAELVRLLEQGEQRLVTLTGPGGVGKTRLALEAAARSRPRFGTSPVFVDLSVLGDPALVMRSLARELGLRELDSRGAGDEEITAAVVELLDGRPALAVLDNAEHVLACAPSVADLVGRCPGLVVLVTSRAPLRVRAEVERPLAPLALPASDGPDGLAASAAARVFLARAEAAGATVPLTQRNAAAVAEICRRLDGLPLALELAAARLRLLSPSALLARLDLAAVGDRGMRDAPARHRTMRATLDWSHDLLQPAERVLLRRLSVFVGGFPLAAAEAVGDEDALPVLGALVEQSLVVPVAGSAGDPEQPRFRLLEPVREYAADLLERAGEAPQVRDRSARYFCDLARHARAALRGPDLADELDRLDAEWGNLQATMRHLLERDRAEEVARTSWDLWLYWGLRGHVAQGHAWLSALPASGLAPAIRCRALGAAAGLHFVAGSIETMHGLAEEALDLALGPGTEADGEARPDDDTIAELEVLVGSARLFAAEFVGAEAVLADALERASRSGSGWAAAHALAASGQRAMLAGDRDAADRLLTEALDRARRLGNAFTLATALNVRATWAELQGDLTLGADLLAEAEHTSATARISWTRVYTLTALAGISARFGHDETAARLFGAAAALSAAHLVDARFPASRTLADAHLAEVRRRFGETAFRRAFEAGRSSTPEEVAALAASLRPPAPG